MQSSVPELIAALCPDHAEIEIYNEKEVGHPARPRMGPGLLLVPALLLRAHESALDALPRRGIKTVAGGRHAGHFADECQKHFDAVVTGEPESNVPALIADFERGELKKRYNVPSHGAPSHPAVPLRSHRFHDEPVRLPGIEASRGCPFTCNFCVLTGHEKYRYRPVREVVEEIRHQDALEQELLRPRSTTGSCSSTTTSAARRVPARALRRADSFKEDLGLRAHLQRAEGRGDSSSSWRSAGCRYVYTGLESLNPESIKAMNKGQNSISEVDEVIRRCFASGIMLSFGLLVGSDGDTNEYLERLPRVPVGASSTSSVTFLGIVCPYPETPFYRQLRARGATTARHDQPRLRRLHALPPPRAAGALGGRRALQAPLQSTRQPDERRATLPHEALASSMPRYKSVILASGPEILSVRNPIRNERRKYIAGQDPIEDWDARMMRELGLTPQSLSPSIAESSAPVVNIGRKVA